MFVFLAAMVTAVGSPRATSRAKEGPDRIASGAPGRQFAPPLRSPACRCLSRCPWRRSPPAGLVPDAASAFRAKPCSTCAGTTSRKASAFAASARSPVTADPSVSPRPAGNGFPCRPGCRPGHRLPAPTGSRGARRPRLPAASAVPQAPAPRTAIWEKELAINRKVAYSGFDPILPPVAPQIRCPNFSMMSCELS